MWEGLRQYVIGGWNTGRAPYGYLPEPQHTRASVKEEIITAALGRFMDTYLLGHDRAAMLHPVCRLASCRYRSTN